MNIVLDTNILFSALLKDSVTRKLILSYDGHFLIPPYMFEELRKHKPMLLQVSGMGQRDLDALLELLLSRMIIVPGEIIEPYWEEALMIVREIDPDDVMFIACALAYPGCILWSDDKKLKRQPKVRVLDTEEMMAYFL